MHSDTPSLQVSHEIIYSAISTMPCGVLRTAVIGWLRFDCAIRRLSACGKGLRRWIPDMVSIHDRPPDVEERMVPGRWEGNLLNGVLNRSAVGTLVERTSLFTVLAKMDDANAESALSGFSQALKRIEAQNVCR